MAKKLNSVLGIDIGSQKIKIAEVRARGKEPEISALGIIDTPEGAVDHTGVYNSDAVGAALKQLLAESGASVNQAVISIAGQASVLVRTLEVPRMNPAELREHMQWEINRNIPFAESNVVSDYRALPDEDANSPNMDVVMAIAPQSAVDTMIACVKKAGRTTAAIDVEPLGIARALQSSHGDEFENQTVCLVDMGHKTTAINIYKNGKLLMPRQIPIGGEMFTKAIADAMGIGVEEAETLKREKAEIPASAASAPPQPSLGAPEQTDDFQPYNPFAEEPMQFGAEPEGEAPPAEPTESFVPEPIQPPPSSEGDPESKRIFATFAPVLDEFLAEVRRSVDYFHSRGGQVERIVLCGGGTKLRGLSAFLSGTLGIPCDAYDPVRRLNVNVRKVAPGFVDEHKQEFAVAIGNGLHFFFD
jgi:type IV pilus assembly protein PilM